MSEEDNLKPVPDPTRLTTEAMARLVAEREELVSAQLEIRDANLKGITGQLKQRLDDMDKANIVLSENVNRVPTNLQTAIVQLKELEDVKFLGMDRIQDVRFQAVAQQFAERDVRSERESRDNKIAVDAAITAQKESAAKTEANITKLIDTITLQIAAGNTALADKIDNLKERVNLAEGNKSGSSAVIVAILGVITTIAVVASVILGIYSATRQ